VLVGIIGLWATRRIGAELFGEPVGLVAGALYVVCPFTFFYDRLALADAYLSSFTALALYWSLTLRRSPCQRHGVWLGLAMAASVLSKVPGLICLGFPPLTLLVLGRPAAPIGRCLATAYGVALSLVAFPVALFLSRTGQLAEKVEMPVGALGRLDSITNNVALASRWLSHYWTPPILLAAGLVAVLAVLKWKRREITLLLAAVGPLAAFVLAAFHWYPRYLLLCTPPFLVLASRGLCALDGAVTGRFFAGREALIGRQGFRVLVALLACWPGAALCLNMTVAPPQARLPAEDVFQYVNGWPSGYGWAETAQFLRSQATRSREPLMLVVDRADHLTAFAVVRAYLQNDRRIEVAHLDMRDPATQERVGAWARARQTFVLRSGARPEKLGELPASEAYSLRLVRTLRKPDGRLVGELYLATPAAASSGA
jgi:4-amino-4-deoxy-L-arabinose transferase-like glycosyltransferase